MATPNGRVREISVVEEGQRHLWLAGQIDEVDDRVLAELTSIRRTLNRILVAVGGLLITVLASTITALITGLGR